MPAYPGYTVQQNKKATSMETQTQLPPRRFIAQPSLPWVLFEERRGGGEKRSPAILDAPAPDHGCTQSVYQQGNVATCRRARSHTGLLGRLHQA